MIKAVSGVYEEITNNIYRPWWSKDIKVQLYLEKHYQMFFKSMIHILKD